MPELLETRAGLAGATSILAEMSDRLEGMCEACGFEGLYDGSDGFFYCQRCNSLAEGVRDTGVDEYNIIEGKEGHAMSHRRQTPAVIKAEPLSQCQPLSQFWESLRPPEDDNNEGDGIGPTEPSDFGMGLRSLSYEDYYSAIRLRYVMGVQIMIELQVKALVEKFNVSPLIVGLVDSIWLRFVASTRIFADEWADEAIHESESQTQGEAATFNSKARHRGEPHNILGKRAVMIWYQSVSKTIPLPYSLAISFLVCHLAREAILPTDIVKWALEGKLPYFAAFVEIEKQIGPPSNACPLSSSRMFRPIQPPPLQKLESLAASIALTIGLELPPVNFYAIASRYLRQLSVSPRNILPYACRIFEWSMPPELWLSANEFKLPTRACVISILIVSIRILYDLNGFGKWENSLSSSCGLSSSADQRGRRRRPTSNTYMNDDTDQKAETAPTCKSDETQFELDAAELLLILEAKYAELPITNEYSKDLTTYLQYCKDVVFSGLELSVEDHEEGKIIDALWDFYQKKEDLRRLEDHAAGSSGHSSGDNKRSRYDFISTPKEAKKFRGNGCTGRNPIDDTNSNNSHTDKTSCSVEHPWCVSENERIRRLKLNMEENRFCYISPRMKKRRFDYLHYVRKKDKGAYAYAAHADYYILLRACARVVELDVRSLHQAVMHFEKRLAWLEKKVDHCLKVLPCIDVCEICCDDDDDDDVEQNVSDDPMGFSKLNL